MAHGDINQAVQLANSTGVKASYSYSFADELYSPFQVDNVTDQQYSSTPYAMSQNDFYNASVYESNIATALSSIAGFASVSFSYTQSSSNYSADIMIYGLDKALYEPGSSGKLVPAFAFGPGVALPYASDIYLTTSNSMGASGLSLQHTISHEMGHTVGLRDAEKSDLGGSPQDTNQFTIMSYNQHLITNRYADELQIYDIASLQYMYGSVENSAGNTVYSSFSDVNGTRMFSIWDSGGVDTIDASQQAAASLIDLRPGYFSSIGDNANVIWSSGGQEPVIISDGIQNVSNAFGTYIENAVGSEYDDVIIGNELSNHILGGGGNDVIFGSGSVSIHDTGAGDYRQIGAGTLLAVPTAISDFISNPRQQSDFIDGGAGSDYIVSGQGFNEIYGGSGNDLINAAGGGMLNGGSGDDIIITGWWAVIDGGAGDDQIFVQKPADITIVQIDGSDPGDELYWNGYRLLGGINMVIEGEITDGQDLFIGNMDQNGFVYGYRADHNLLAIGIHDSGSIIINDFQNGDFGIFLPPPPGDDEFDWTIDNSFNIVGYTTSLPLSNIAFDGLINNWQDLAGYMAVLNNYGPFEEPTMFMA